MRHDPHHGLADSAGQHAAFTQPVDEMLCGTDLGGVEADEAGDDRRLEPRPWRLFDRMAEEESGHRRSLLELFQERYGNNIPLIRREDVRGFMKRKPLWMSASFDIDTIRKRAASMEAEAANFYRRAASRSSARSQR